MTFKRLKKISHKTLAGFMAIWLSGVVFLFCCEEINGKSMDTEFCPLAKMSEHCDKAAAAETEAAVVASTESDGVDCCEFLPAVFDKVRKTEQTQKQIAATLKPAALKFRLPPLANSSPPITAFHSRTPNRQTTFVKNCVFRI